MAGRGKRTPRHFEAQVLQGIDFANHEPRELAEPIRPRLMVCAGHAIATLLEFVEVGRFVASDEGSDSEFGSGDKGHLGR